MWQVLVAAAAAAGSGILAKKLISPNDAETPISDREQNDLDCDNQSTCSAPHDSIADLNDAIEESSNLEERESFGEDGKIFRFSCPETGFRDFRKINRNGFRGVKKNGESKRGKRNVVVECGRKEVVGDQVGNGSGKKVSVCLKKRRTGKHVAGKCESCSSKDKSFGWGVGLGVMYMMSAGNSEIAKLNSAMDETVKTVQELKAEISRTQRPRNVNVSGADNEAETHKKFVARSCNGPLFISNSINNIKAFDPAMIEESEHASSTLTVDQQPEELEMHRLEVELESELQKLPLGATEGSSSEGRTNIIEAEDWANNRASHKYENSISYQYGGVAPAELDQRLCHLLIEQQESQIFELETELHHAHSKLHQKETELQALKDCVKRLTQFSLTNASDGETEEDGEDVKTMTNGIEKKLEFESPKSMVGMKPTFGYESYICSKNSH